MKRIAMVVVLLFVAVLAKGAVYKQGEAVLDKNWKVEIVKAQWGQASDETDHIVGTIRVLDHTTFKSTPEVTLTFDIYSRNAVKSEMPPYSSKPEKIGTITFTVNLMRYEYKQTKQYVWGDFVYDFPVNKNAARIFLSDVSINKVSVPYNIAFNLNGTLLKTLFKLQLPKTSRR